MLQFQLSFLRRELTRRLGRTILTASGLALAVGLVVVVRALSTGLDQAQGSILDPLERVGTDLMVSRPLELPTAGAQASGSSAAGLLLGGGVSGEELDRLMSENQDLFQTDFSTLGAPGLEFEREIWLPATQLTFSDAEVRRVQSLPGIDTVAAGLSLLAVHQRGKVPEIVATFETGGETFDVTRKIPPPSQAEWDSITNCISRSGRSAGCLPGRFRNFATTFTTPREIIKQVLDPPQTDVATEPYTAAGVDVHEPGLGLITPAQMAGGRFFSRPTPTGADALPASSTTGAPSAPAETGGAPPASPNEVILAQGYASRKQLRVGSKVVLNQTEYTVVGVARPPLGGQSADVYLPLDHLQYLSGRAQRVNLMFVRADKAADVAALARSIERAFPGSQVTSARELADRISGSLVSAGNLADRLGLALAVIALVSAFLIASLLTLSSVTKRVRELGTLSAIGWRRSRIIRQVLSESLAQGALGAIAGVALGLAACGLISAAAPELHASAAQQVGPLNNSFGLGAVLADQASETVRLQAPASMPTVAGGVVLALLGGLLAGGAGAVRAARLRPADALREFG